ncbi:MAG: hypothetical protein HYR51_05015 [Candidatus Rokubacteria bacterium]|nr:hypothetical protein [Candidatus Rokubacteria bacterium]
MRTVLVAIAIALVALAGLCLVDADNGHPGGIDFCFFVLATLALPLPALVELVERVVPARVARCALVSLDCLVPPPRA